jgi:anti-sigma B factor antagonist
MSLEIGQSQRDGISILALKGQLTFGQGDAFFRDRLEQLMTEGESRFVFDLTKLTDLDQTGVSTLLSAIENLRRAGGTAAICNADPRHLALLAETRLEVADEVFPTEEDALESFFADKGIRHYDVLEFVEAYRLKSAKP